MKALILATEDRATPGSDMSAEAEYRRVLENTAYPGTQRLNTQIALFVAVSII